ncbi:hypothetical protein PDE_01382 [Penicillium oxalicum 114-2]|uniref:Uncharacterized protein n=1 Tax=Penicillium oxalicum (strain 114-2 / CGMCC 5302) TaxID=933388 RepID=S7Z7B4_PENO1|nr:hypothetical protein PDE_01382 [Penicillium oxalicum 114-2]
MGLSFLLGRGEAPHVYRTFPQICDSFRNESSETEVSALGMATRGIRGDSTNSRARPPIQSRSFDSLRLDEWKSNSRGKIDGKKNE